MRLVLPASVRAQAATPGYQTGFVSWRAAEHGFDGWQLDGVRLAPDGSLCLDAATARGQDDPYGPGGYRGRSFYNGASFLVGEAVSPPVGAGFHWAETIPSWNADTAPGTWLETRLRVRLDDRWTRWFSLGVWAADASTVERHSVDRQTDADGQVATDTLIHRPMDAVQLQLRLFSTDPLAMPTVRNASVALATTPTFPSTFVAGNPEQWGRVLEVPACSQMVYPDGGEVWCSPTSTAMVLGYWGLGPEPCEPGVRAAVSGVYDWLYRGHGNWPFNTAYAATQGLEAQVVRFSSLAQAEAWIAAGMPLVLSYAWSRGELAGAPVTAARGHLGVLVGFDSGGNPVVNDPAAASDQVVQRTYDRAQFERLWLGHSGGTAYVMYPPGWSTPAL